MTKFANVESRINGKVECSSQSCECVAWWAAGATIEINVLSEYFQVVVHGGCVRWSKLGIK